MFLSIIKDDQSNVIEGEDSSLEPMIDFNPGKNASFHNGRVVQGTVNDGLYWMYTRKKKL